MHVLQGLTVQCFTQSGTLCLFSDRELEHFLVNGMRGALTLAACMQTHFAYMICTLIPKNKNVSMGYTYLKCLSVQRLKCTWMLVFGILASAFHHRKSTGQLLLLYPLSWNKKQGSYPELTHNLRAGSVQANWKMAKRQPTYRLWQCHTCWHFQTTGILAVLQTIIWRISNTEA